LTLILSFPTRRSSDLSIYSGASDFFFQTVFVATAMSVVSGAVAERMKLWAFLSFAVVMTAFIYPMEGSWTWGGNDVFGLYNLGEDRKSTRLNSSHVKI